MSWILNSIFGEQGEGVPENSNESTLSTDDVRARRYENRSGDVKRRRRKEGGNGEDSTSTTVT